MSISTDKSSVLYTGNGATGIFPFDFRVWKPSQIIVTQADADGVETDITARAVVTLTETGGTVTLPAALPAGYKLAISRSMPFVQEDRYITGTRFDPHEIEDALDIACAERQELREKQERTLVVPITSEKTPGQVMDEILDTAATANEYAVQAEATFQEVVKTAEQVAQNKASVDLSLASINVSEANVTRLAGQVMDYSDELEIVAENVEGIETVNRNQDAIAALAADLQGYPIYEFDGGWITDPVQPMNGVGGVLRIVAENIDIIKQVAGSLENSEALLTLADDVSEIGSTDYTGIDQTGEA